MISYLILVPATYLLYLW